MRIRNGCTWSIPKRYAQSTTINIIVGSIFKQKARSDHVHPLRMRIAAFPFYVLSKTCVSRVMCQIILLMSCWRIHAISTKLVRMKRYMCLVVISCIFFQLGWLGKKLKQIIEMKSADIRGLLGHLLSSSFSCPLGDPQTPLSGPQLPKILSIGRPVLQSYNNNTIIIIKPTTDRHAYMWSVSTYKEGGVFFSE